MVSMKLSEYENIGILQRDGSFKALGHADSNVKGTLAYGDTVFYIDRANKNENISCLITKREYAKQVDASKGLLLCQNPRDAFYELHNELLTKNLIDLKLNCTVGKGCEIHPRAIVSRKTKIGNNVVISENAVIKDNVIIGDNTFIDAGVVIGNEGLLYITKQGRHCRVKHGGGVEIGENVAILSNAVVVKSIHETLLTRIGDNSIIGIMSAIGHEAQIGANCVISGNCVIARRATVKDGAWIGSSSVVREYISIGENAQVMAGSVVVKDVAPGKSVSGNFAVDHSKRLKDFLRS